jgi:hypothetical protein
MRTSHRWLAECQLIQGSVVCGRSSLGVIAEAPFERWKGSL